MRLRIFVLLAFLSISSAFSQEYALVLAGGGGKGAYQVGVWKALNEYGIAQKVSVISGTSVGGLNGALFAGTSASNAEKVWTEQVSAKLTKDGALISQKGLSELLEDFPLEDLYDSRISVYVTAVRDRLKLLKFVNSKIQGPGWGNHSYYFYINKDSSEDMRSKLLATSAFPIVCESVWVKDSEGGHYYSDGGEESVGGDNIPIKPIIENYPQIKNIIVVYLSDINHISRRIRAKDYDNLNIIEFFPSIDLDGDGLFEGIVDGTANFSENRIKLLIQKGYEDTVDFFHRRKIFPVSSYWFN